MAGNSYRQIERRDNALMRLINGTGGQPEELRLPPSYRLDRSDPDLLVLRRPDGTVVARYSARGHTKEAVELEARKDD